MSEAEFGLLSLYNISSTFPSTLFFGPLGQGILRIFSIAQEKNEFGAFRQDYATLFKTGVILTLLTGLLGALTCWFFGQEHWAIAMIIMALLNIFNAYNSIAYGLQNIQRKRMTALGLETGDRVLQQFIALSLLLWVSKDPLIIIGGYLIGAVMFSAINYFFVSPTLFTSVDAVGVKSRTYRRLLLDYSWPFFIFGALQWIQSSSDRWTLELLRSTELVGQYAVINQIGFQSLTLFFGSIGYFLFPILFNKAGSLKRHNQFNDANRLNNYFLAFNLGITICIALLFWPFGEWVIRFLSSEKYVKIAWMLPFMAISGGLFNFCQNYANRFLISMQTKLLMYSRVSTSILSVFINLMAVYTFGLVGLVFSTIITQVIGLMFLMIAWNTGKKRISTINYEITH